MLYLFFALLIVAILFGVFVTFFWSAKRKWLSNERKGYYQKELWKTSSLPSPSERILQYDKILSHILKDCGYEGTVGDQLKAKPMVIDNLDTIWDLHKLRNRLAHDMQTISISVLEKKSREFEKELRKLIAH